MPDEIVFKHVGRTVRQAVQTAVTGSVVNFGIKLPIAPGPDQGGVFATNKTLADQIRDDLKNLLLTDAGQRVILHDFGADLSPLVSELVSLDGQFEDQVVARIRTAVQRWMPYLSLRRFSSRTERFENQHIARIVVRIEYDVPTVGIVDQATEVVIRVM